MISDESGSRPICRENVRHKARIVTYPSRNQLMDDLFMGKLTAAYIDQLEESKWRKSRKDFDLFLRTIPNRETSYPISIAVSPRAPHLAYCDQSLFETEVQRRLARSVGSLLSREP